MTIVPGSDTDLIGYGLDRELELYVQAGMTPIAAIQAATIVSARVMKLEKESGSVEVGKRADLMLVDGDPLKNISDIRRVVSVVKMAGCMTASNWRIVWASPVDGWSWRGCTSKQSLSVQASRECRGIRSEDSNYKANGCNQ